MRKRYRQYGIKKKKKSRTVNVTWCTQTSASWPQAVQNCPPSLRDQESAAGLLIPPGPPGCAVPADNTDLSPSEHSQAQVPLGHF